MKDVVSQIFAMFSQYGYGAVFAGVMLDNAGVPMAGETTLLIAGSLVAGGSMGWLPTVLVAAVAALFSDSIWYGAGRVGAAHLVRVYCRFSFGSSACMTKTEEMLAHFGPRGLIFARFVPGFRTFAAPMSGISGLSLPRFLLFDGIGALLWSATAVTLGMFFAVQINKIFEQMQAAQSVVLIFVGAMIGMFILLKIWVRARHGRAEILPRSALPGDVA